MPGVVENGAKSKGKGKISKMAYRRQQAKAKANSKATPSEADKPVQDESGAHPSELPASKVRSADDAKAVQIHKALNIDDFVVDDELGEQFKEVLDKFNVVEEEVKPVQKQDIFFEQDDIQDEEQEAEMVKKLSKKKWKSDHTLSVAELKAKVKKPELVEWTDTSSSDPELLITLKGAKNAIPVPTHWSLKREYLSSKRGIEKPPFQLPKFIADTGIAEMRQAILDKQENMSLKQKQRERVQGKVGKMDLDYTKLYAAFFRHQTKPVMTPFGEVYYEGKEYETNLRHLRPGELSDELKDALGMQPGAPPPWLINQQRFGPPPTYNNMRIPGVNAPIPPGASWGFAPGQWGKPPVDDHNRPLFGGDLFGTAIFDQQQIAQPTQLGEPVEKGYWGLLNTQAEDEQNNEQEEDEEEEEEIEEEAPAYALDEMSGMQTSMTSASAQPAEIGGIESIGGDFTLRKQRRGGTETEEPSAPRSAYQVLPEKNIQATGFFGGEHAYDLGAARHDRLVDDRGRKRKAGDVDVAVDVDALAQDGRLDKDALKKQYEAQQKADMQGTWQSVDMDDMADMIEAEGRKRQKREERRRDRR